MNRLEFIRNISLTGVGISLTPTRLFADSKHTTVQLPQPAIHLPHGNFAATQLESIHIPELELSISVQHFMRNGLGRCEKDLTVFTLTRNDEVAVMGSDTVSGFIGGLNITAVKGAFTVANESYQLELRPNSNHTTLTAIS